MRLKELQSALEGLQPFTNPKAHLEQYVTSAHLAAQMLFAASTQYDDIEAKNVLDLGCGTCVLSIAAKLAGAAWVLGVDIDKDALSVACENLQEMEMQDEIDLIQLRVDPTDSPTCDQVDKDVWHHLIGKFDTVITNPPFGTKTQGTDIVFLERAFQVAPTTVYSLHKTSTRAFIQRQVRKFGFEGKVLAQMRYDLPKSMKFHKDRTRDIEVDFWRFERIS